MASILSEAKVFRLKNDDGFLLRSGGFRLKTDDFLTENAVVSQADAEKSGVAIEVGGM